MKVSKTSSSRIGKFLFLVTFVGAAIFLTADLVQAQEDASLAGIVRDISGAGIADATVHVVSLETGKQRELLTDEEGRFLAVALPVGRYDLTADKTGFRSEKRTGIVLVVGQREELDLTLKVGDIHQIVEVRDDPGLLSTATGDTSGLVGERQVKDLPLNGRSYDQLLTLNPGTVNYTSQRAGGTGTSNSQLGNMFSVSGHRPQENLFLLNGIEYTGASEISNTPGGVSGQLLGVDAVREFAVVKDAYGAEYGKRPGAQVSIVTAGSTHGISLTREAFPSSNETSSVARSAGRFERTTLFSLQTTKVTGRFWD